MSIRKVGTGEPVKAGGTNPKILEALELLKDIRTKTDEMVTMMVAATVFIDVKKLGEEFGKFAEEHFGLTDGPFHAATVPVEEDMPF